MDGEEGDGEKVNVPAVETASANDIVSRLRERAERQPLRRLTRRRCDSRYSSLQRCNPLFQNSDSRVSDATVDVTSLLQAEKVGGVLSVVEDEGGRLVDRDGFGLQKDES